MLFLVSIARTHESRSAGQMPSNLGILSGHGSDLMSRVTFVVVGLKPVGDNIAYANPGFRAAVDKAIATAAEDIEAGEFEAVER